MRSRRIKKQLWLNEIEDSILKKKCEYVGMNASDYMRYLIIGYQPKEQPCQEFYNHLRDIRKIGNNINQIVRLANATNKVDVLFLNKELNLLNEIIMEIKIKYLRPDKPESELN